MSLHERIAELADLPRAMTPHKVTERVSLAAQTAALEIADELARDGWPDPEVDRLRSGGIVMLWTPALRRFRSETSVTEIWIGADGSLDIECDRRLR